MKKAIFLVVAFLLAAATLLVNFQSTSAGRERDKIRICHATASNSNPYVENEPDKSGDVDGHDGHDGPVWFDGIEVSWGDIIPPFTYGDDESYPGKNWTEDGQEVWENDCEIEDDDEPCDKECEPSDTPTASPTVSPEPTTSPEPTGEPTATPAETGEPTEEPKRTEEPTSTPISCPEGKHLDASGQNCVEYQFGGPGGGGGTTGGQVLGASTMAATGTFTENLYLAIMGLGGLLTFQGIKKALRLN